MRRRSAAERHGGEAQALPDVRPLDRRGAATRQRGDRRRPDPDRRGSERLHPAGGRRADRRGGGSGDEGGAPAAAAPVCPVIKIDFTKHKAEDDELMHFMEMEKVAVRVDDAEEVVSAMEACGGRYGNVEAAMRTRVP